MTLKGDRNDQDSFREDSIGQSTSAKSRRCVCKVLESKVYLNARKMVGNMVVALRLVRRQANEPANEDAEI